MTHEISRRVISSPAERAHGRVVRSTRHVTDETTERVAAITHLTQHAQMGVAGIFGTRRSCELLYPEAAAALELISNAGIMNLAAVVHTFDGRP